MANISETNKDIQNGTSTFCTTIPPAVSEKKLGELWSTNYRDKAVKSYPPRSTFSEDHISASKWCYALKFLHVLENGQVGYCPKFLVQYATEGMLP